MDSLKSLETVQSELTSLTTNIDTLNKIINDLKGDEANITAAWQSDNANSFKSQYTELLSNLTEAANYLDSYKKKIESVVREIIGFDTTIQNQNNG